MLLRGARRNVTALKVECSIAVENTAQIPLHRAIDRRRRTGYLSGRPGRSGHHAP
jgi:hypothetical protein